MLKFAEHTLAAESEQLFDDDPVQLFRSSQLLKTAPSQLLDDVASHRLYPHRTFVFPAVPMQMFPGPDPGQLLPALAAEVEMAARAESAKAKLCLRLIFMVG